MIQQGRFSPIWALLVPLFMIKSSASNEYTAAVYEHSTVFELGIHTRSQALKVMKENIAVFQEKCRLAKEKEADIIVLPEDGLYGFSFTRDEINLYLDDIPNPSSLSKSWNPCKEPDRFSNTEVTHLLSCMARNFSIAVVANMGDVSTVRSRTLTALMMEGTSSILMLHLTLMARYLQGITKYISSASRELILTFLIRKRLLHF